jgi:hypothetical protein
MRANRNDYDEIVDLISRVRPTNPMRKHDIENLQTLIGLSIILTMQDRQQLKILLFYLGLETQAAESMKEAEHRS